MQGRAPTTQSGHKQEPRGQGDNPGGVSQIGLAQSEPRSITPMYEGKVGPFAPMTQSESLPSGSQGRHK